MSTSGSLLLPPLVVGVGIKQMRDAVMPNRWRKERVKLWIFREIAKWRRWRHAPRPTATAVVTDSHRHFFDDMTRRRCQNLAGDDQATLMVDRKSAIYVCLS